MAGLNRDAKPFVPPSSDAADESVSAGFRPFPGSMVAGGLPAVPFGAPFANRAPNAIMNRDVRARPDVSNEYLTNLLRRAELPKRACFPHALSGTHYDHLDLARDASAADIADAFRRWEEEGFDMAVAIDATRAAVLDRIIVEAAQVLLTPAFRVAYDKTIPTEDGAVDTGDRPEPI
jgi:hypothetical protein